MEGNKFELTGRITYIDVKYSEKSGNAFTRVLMSKKNTQKENEYDTYPFVFFGAMAEAIAEQIKKGDTANITGRIGVSKYEKDGKTIEKLELYGTSFLKVKYDEKTKSYVPLNESNVDTSAGEEEVPW